VETIFSMQLVQISTYTFNARTGEISPSLPGNFCGTVHSAQIMDLSVVGGC